MQKPLNSNKNGNYLCRHLPTLAAPLRTNSCNDSQDQTEMWSLKIKSPGYPASINSSMKTSEMHLLRNRVQLVIFNYFESVQKTLMDADDVELLSIVLNIQKNCKNAAVDNIALTIFL